MDGIRTTRAVLAAVAGAAFTLVVPLATTVEAATFVVNDTRDRLDARPGNGTCRTSSGTCTLRAAIQEANARPEADVITVRPGTYTITRAPLNDNDITTGDLDITAPVTINGAGAGISIVDGGTPPAGTDASRSALDRLVEIHPGAGDVSLSGLTLREGWDDKEGGALVTRSAGAVRLVAVDVRGSFAGTAGGGIYVDGGSLTIASSQVSGNATNGEGGGIHVARGRLAVTGSALAPSTVTANTARNGGGIHNAGLSSPVGETGRASLVHTTVSGNAALNAGGGVDNRLAGLLELTDVTLSANHAAGDGGGVASGSKSTVRAVRATFAGNDAGGSGGGVFTHTEGPVEVEGSAFTANGAGEDGGGLAVYGSGSVAVSDSTFTANTAAGEGGGIAIHSDGPVAVADTVVRDNAAALSGGGILASGRVVDLARLTVTGNTAVETGGGIDNQGSGELTITDTTVAGNAATDGGGFANRADSTLLVARSTFSHNHATLTGGGFHHQSDAATEIVNTTLSGNTAGFNGGGLYLDADAGLHVVNATVSRNAAPYGSGVGTSDPIDNFPVASHPLLLFRNTIVAGNVGGPDCHAAFGSEGGNLDGGTLCNFAGPHDRTNADPTLLPLAANGGPTLTHALLASSPAVGAGVEPCPADDQRGVVREADRPCDAGAVEFEGTPAPPPPGMTPPDTRLDSGPSDTTESTEATFAFSSGDASATFECSLDRAPLASCQSPLHYTELAFGTHTFEVRAVDNVGLADPTPASYAWTIAPPPDTRPPETAIDAAPPTPSAHRDATFTFSADDPAATFECSLDGVSFAACTTPVVYLGLAAGAHAFAVRAADAAGNQDPTPASHSWTVEPPADTTPPVTTFTVVPPATTEAVDATFAFVASEPGSTFRCAVDGPSFNACISPVTLAGLSVGTHTFQVLAADPAGNDELAAVGHTWTIEAPRDATPPETLLASGPASPTQSTSAQFTFSSSESGSTFECSLDGAAFASCSSPVAYAGLGADDHTFEVRAVDPAGNVDPTPESYTWTVEAPPPPAPPLEISLDSGPASPTESMSARFTFSASRSGATFECSLDGSVFATCSSPVEHRGLLPGDHTFDVRASDSVGNADAASYSWTIVSPPACGPAVTAAAEADAWIDENSSSTNKGSDSILKVQSKAPRDNFRALLRFAMPASIPAGCLVESATLSVYAASSAPDRTLAVLRITEPWSEGAATWNNQPATAGDAATARSGTGYREWDVTSLVAAMYAAGGNHGFVIRDEEGGTGHEQQFHSREKGEAPPRLVITFAPAGP